jgi:hypothetical protein
MYLHCKKRLAIFPARKSLVVDIPAGDGKIANLFYSACQKSWYLFTPIVCLEIWKELWHEMDWAFAGMYTVKKDQRFFRRPQPGSHQPDSLWPGTIKLFPARESLVSDIPAGDWKIGYLF